MGQFELSILIFFFAQPFLLGYVVASLTWGYLGQRVARWGGGSRRLTSLNFFECATFSRWGGALAYDVLAFALGLVFILYDVDLIFFLSEVSYVGGWGLVEGLTVVLFFSFFCWGLWYDNQRGGLEWGWGAIGLDPWHWGED